MLDISAENSGFKGRYWYVYRMGTLIAWSVSQDVAMKAQKGWVLEVDPPVQWNLLTAVCGEHKLKATLPTSLINSSYHSHAGHSLLIQSVYCSSIWFAALCLLTVRGLLPQVYSLLLYHHRIPYNFLCNFRFIFIFSHVVCSGFSIVSTYISVTSFKENLLTYFRQTSHKFMESSLEDPTGSIWQLGLKIAVFFSFTLYLTSANISQEHSASSSGWMTLLEVLAATSFKMLLSVPKLKDVVPPKRVVFSLSPVATWNLRD